MFDPYDKQTIKRLLREIELSHADLETVRNSRDALIEKVAHASLRKSIERNRKPVNLLELAITVYESILAPNELKARVVPKNARLKESADALSAAIESVARSLNVGDIISQAVIDAMMAFAVVKVGVAHGDAIDIGGVSVPGTDLYIARVDLDDWVQDTRANTFGDAYFMGHAVTLYLDDLRCDPDIDRTALGRIIRDASREDRQTLYDQTVDETRRHTDTEKEMREAMEPEIKLWEIFIPRHGLILLLADELEIPLKVQEWDGPECGPYHMLRFLEMPKKNAVVPPMPGWIDLDDLVNSTYNKVARRGTKAKEVIAYPPGAKEDAQKIVDAEDMETVEVDPNSVGILRLGSIDNNQLAFGIHVYNLATSLMGNLQLLAGISAQSETAQQDRMLAENANRRLAKMQQVIVEFTSGILNSLAWHLWHDPTVSIPITRRLDLAGIEIEDVFDETSKLGAFTDYGITVHPQSLRHDSPATRAMMIEGIINRIVAPLAPTMQKEGLTINTRRLMEILADSYDLPELEQIITNINEPVEGGTVGDVPASPNSIRKHIRINSSAQDTALNNPQAIVRSLGGGESPPAMANAAQET